jgi:hypothetical protein
MKPVSFITALALTALPLSASTIIPLWGDGTITVSYTGQGATCNLNAGNSGAVGGNGSSRTFYQISSYNVGTILSSLGYAPVAASLASLADYTFAYAGTTVAGSASPGWDFADTFEYRAAYIGHWADTGTAGTSAGDVPQTGLFNPSVIGQTTNVNWTRYHDAAQAIAAAAMISFVDTNTADTAEAQNLNATGFDLSGLATTLAGDTDLSDNYVFFGFYLSPDYEISPAANQEISGVTLTAIPEPASVALLVGLSLAGLCRRRR